MLPKREPDDVVAGHLEVGRTDNFAVVINFPAMDVDHDGRGHIHICFSPRQAKALARLLQKQARIALEEYQSRGE